MRTSETLIVIVGLTLLLAACSGTAPQEATAASAGLSISIETDPSPAMMGNVEISLKIQDGSGDPFTGAEVFVIADHKDMSGMTMSGQASELENGIYVIQADFSMTGNWMLQVEVKRDGQSEVQEIPIAIQ